jgi:hypothetical protein
MCRAPCVPMTLQTPPTPGLGSIALLVVFACACETLVASQCWQLVGWWNATAICAAAIRAQS